MIAPRKPGRPPRSGKSSDVRISIRLTKAEHREWLRLAGDLPLSVWLRLLVAHEAAS